MDYYESFARSCGTDPREIDRGRRRGSGKERPVDRGPHQQVLCGSASADQNIGRTRAYSRDGQGRTATDPEAVASPESARIPFAGGF